MCGRFSMTITEEVIKNNFDDIRIDFPMQVSYNVAPTHNSYVITNDKPHRLQYFTWGLVPYWSEDGENKGRLINARKEGIAGKISFRIPIRKQRCLVLADSFYEWKKNGYTKIPYRVVPIDGDLMVMAGIWDVWQQNDRIIKSFAIITTGANREMSEYHTRMPVLLQTKAQQNAWLSDLPLENVLGMLQTPKDGSVLIYRVSEKVNFVEINTPELHDEIPEPPNLFTP